MERELITLHQANLLMIMVLILSPLTGLICGARTKRVRLGLAIGLLVGCGNFVLWTIYNGITNRLGLDTVKNLLVNLALFSIIGIVVGFTAARSGTRARKGKI